MSQITKYSVVVCSFNKLPYLKKVSERLKLLRPENELILTDDFSTDGTIEWAENSGIFSKIHVEKEPGSYRLNTIRNCGISLASNEYVVLLDADCLPDNSYFNGYDEVFNLFPQSAAIGITEKYDSSGERIIHTDPRWVIYEGNKILKCGWEHFYGGNVAFPKKAWETYKFDESYNGSWGFEDLDFGAGLNKNGICFYFSFLSSVRHLEHPICKQSVEANSGKCRNQEMLEKKYKIKFFKKYGEEKILKKKILICKNVKPLRNGNRNAKDYPYWEDLIKLLYGNELTFVEGEIPLKDLDSMIANCDFFISIDSFFQHYAWYLNKKGAVIFSVTDPLIFGHSFHVNILKDRKYLRKNQFLFMEEELYNADAFESPENVYKAIASAFK